FEDQSLHVLRPIRLCAQAQSGDDTPFHKQAFTEYTQLVFCKLFGKPSERHLAYPTRMHGFHLLSFQGYVLNHGLIPPPDHLFGVIRGCIPTGRRIDAIDADDEITLVNDADNKMFDVDDLGGEEVFVAEQEFVNTAAITEIITTEEITLAQALEELKTLKPKAKRIVFQEPDIRTDLVKEKENRAGEELIQESTKKQKVEDDKEKTELKQLMETIPDEEEVAINAISLAVKSSRIVD
nr:hypothetical protein [Tanacetum cinerariifolium]